jgi:hypothetical protein
MNLREYLYENRIRQVDAARELKMLPGTLNNVIHGVKCGPGLAKKLSDWTKGVVSVEELLTRGTIRKRCRHCGSLVKVKR